MCRFATRILSVLCLALIICLQTFSQTDYTSKLSSWKTLFPKEDVIAYSYKETVSFALNTNPKPGEGNVKVSVVNDLVLVPLKDFMKYQDGLFYNDEISIDNVKAINTKGKEVPVQKLCGSFQSDDIFHSDSKLCSVQFPMEE